MKGRERERRKDRTQTQAFPGLSDEDEEASHTSDPRPLTQTRSHEQRGRSCRTVSSSSGGVASRPGLVWTDPAKGCGYHAPWWPQQAGTPAAAGRAERLRLLVLTHLRMQSKACVKTCGAMPCSCCRIRHCSRVTDMAVRSLALLQLVKRTPLSRRQT